MLKTLTKLVGRSRANLSISGHECQSNLDHGHRLTVQITAQITLQNSQAFSKSGWLSENQGFLVDH
jgi:hypothetical protein